MRANTFMKPCDNALGAAPYPHLGAMPPFNRFVGKSDCDANALMSCAVIHWLFRRNGTGFRFIRQRRRE